MEKGWDAKGRLEALWNRVGGRDGLAKLTGIQASTLSGYNTGRLPMGKDNGAKIASALEVSIYDLGATRATDQMFVRSLLGQAVEQIRRNPPADLEVVREVVAELRALASDLEARVDEDGVALP